MVRLLGYTPSAYALDVLQIIVPAINLIILLYLVYRDYKGWSVEPYWLTNLEAQISAWTKILHRDPNEILTRIAKIEQKMGELGCQYKKERDQGGPY